MTKYKIINIIFYFSLFGFFLFSLSYIAIKKANFRNINKKRFIILNIIDIFLLLLIELLDGLTLFGLHVFKFFPNLLIQISSILMIIFLVKSEDCDFKQCLFPKISLKNIFNSIIFSLPIFLLLLLPLILNKIIIFYKLENEVSLITKNDNVNTISEMIIKLSSINSKINSYIIIIMNLLVCAFLEEYIFRYKSEYIYNSYISLYNKKDRVEYPQKNDYFQYQYIFYSIIFAILHFDFNFLHILGLFVFSMYLFWYKRKAKSIIPLSLFHFVYNIIIEFT
jgi:hypothetical protein